MRARQRGEPQRRPLSLQVAVLGGTRLIEQLERGSGTEVRRAGPLPQRPDELLVRGHFQHLDCYRSVLLRLEATRAPVAHDGIPVGQPADLLDGEQLDAGHVLLGEFPDDFSLGIHFAHLTMLVATDQRVTVLEPDGRPG